MTYSDLPTRFVSIKGMSLSEEVELQDFLRRNSILPADGIKRNGYAEGTFNGFYNHKDADKMLAWLKVKEATEGHQAILETESCP